MIKTEFAENISRRRIELPEAKQWKISERSMNVMGQGDGRVRLAYPHQVEESRCLFIFCY